jgi:tRNA pseudouridine32 synthase / 23S rRNA pseudouridine746 synthase
MSGFTILHQEEHFLVIDKPSGLLCQPGRSPELHDSLIVRVREAFEWAELVHRLDRDTSGLILIALDPEAHRRLSRSFEERQVMKTYIGLCEGRIPESHGALISPLAKITDHPPEYGEHPSGRIAVTLWRAIDHSGSTTRVSLQPITGRSHQLRVHMKDLGHPLLGDPIYGTTANRLHLHASDLVLPHPHDGVPLTLYSPTPF